jgi:hypothetical protein
MRVLATLLLASLSGGAWANSDEIPLGEHEFVERMKTTGKAEIVAQLGEPARAIDVKDDETGEIIGSIWHYQYLNTTENGDYYKTTELDFVGDQVVTVVFSAMEDTGSDTPTIKPEEPEEPELIQP